MGRNNAELIEDACRLGHIDPDADRVIDLTYGKGNWWKIIRPRHFTMIDISPNPKAPLARCVRKMDATDLPDSYGGSFDVAAVDPPYKLNGTDQGEGERYGVQEYASATDRHDLARRMMVEGIRVLAPGGRLFYKCQDQVNGGHLRWQSFDAYRWATEAGMVLVEQMWNLGGRRQPDRVRWRCLACERDHTGPVHECGSAERWSLAAGIEALGDAAFGGYPWLEAYPSPQEHARYRPSTLMIFRKLEP